jgi:hypothetical protein
MWAAVFLLAGWAGGASSQVIFPNAAGPGCAPPPGCPVPSQPAAPGAVAPGTPGTPGAAETPSPPAGGTTTPAPETAAPPAAPTGGQDPFGGAGRTDLYQSNLSAAGAGVSPAAAATTKGGLTSFQTFTPQLPVIMPGLLTAATTQSARPMDRVFLGYSYLDSFQVVRQQAFVSETALGPTSRGPGFNLNRFDVGFEKTFFEGRASVYVLAPYMSTTSNVTGQSITGFGDVSAGFKFAILEDRDSGSVLTGGFTVAAPTAHATVIPAQSQFDTGKAGSFASPTVLESTSVNPTFLQPWVAALWVRDRLFVQEYFGVLIPTDDRVATFLNNDLAVGYQIYRAPGRFISWVTPTIDAQALIPVSHHGTPSQAGTGAVETRGPMAEAAGTPLGGLPPPTLGASDQLFLTSGFQFGLGERAALSAGIVTPLVGPRAFNYGVTVGFNFFY